MSEGIYIKRAVLHILDSNVGMPVFSARELDLDGEASDFLEKHIAKVLEDNNLREAVFIEDNNIAAVMVKRLAEDRESFLQVSAELADILYGIMAKNVEIPPADLVFCLYESDMGLQYGILKLNYKTGYTHYVEQGEEGNANSIIRHRTLLPLESQKLDECALVSLGDLKIKLLEKAYEINGEKQFYLSGMFLNCTTQLSNNEKVKIIEKVAKKINKKFFDEDFDKAAKLKKAVSETIEETNAIQVDTVAGEVFDNVEIRNEYFSEIQKAGLTEKTVPVPEKIVEKKFRTHKIRTDTGIEINFPLSCYNDADKIEFFNNPDGTISIVIKNINKITNS
jgi:hypothetical protein